MKISNSTFNKDWLNERYHFDCIARNENIEQACLAYLSDKKQVTLVDIGSGTGANFLYFFEKIPTHQKWIFIEQNENLAKESLVRIQKQIEEKGYSFSSENNIVRLKKEDREIEIHVKVDSFDNLEKLVNLDEVDLVTAGAVFDLMSFNQFLDIGSLLFDHQVALLSTLNYHSMSFEPEELGDQFFISKYEDHLIRPQDFGSAMGNKSSRHIVNFFQKKQSEVQYGKSTWHLNGNDSEGIYNHLLDFISRSVPETLEDDDDFDHLFFEEWLTLKKEMAKKGQLNAEVNHYDIFVINKWE